MSSRAEHRLLGVAAGQGADRDVDRGGADGEAVDQVAGALLHRRSRQGPAGGQFALGAHQDVLGDRHAGRGGAAVAVLRDVGHSGSRPARTGVPARKTPDGAAQARHGVDQFLLAAARHTRQADDLAGWTDRETSDSRATPSASWIVRSRTSRTGFSCGAGRAWGWRG